MLESLRVLVSSVIFQQQDKLWWAAVLAGVGIAAVLVTYWRFPQRGGWKWLAASLKIAGLFLLLFCTRALAGPEEAEEGSQHLPRGGGRQREPADQGLWIGGFSG